MKAKDKKLKEIRKQKNSNRQKLSDTTSTKGRKRFLELNGDDNNDEMEIDKWLRNSYGTNECVRPNQEPEAKKNSQTSKPSHINI